MGKSARIRRGGQPYRLPVQRAAGRMRPFLLLLIACTASVRAQEHDSPGLDTQRANQQTFHEAVARVIPSIVQIETVGGAQPHDATPSGQPEAGGNPNDPKRVPKPFVDTTGSNFLVADGPTTGIVYSSDGLILTSSFNFVRNPVLITVKLPDGRRLVADLVGRDQVRKLALLKIDANDLPAPEWAPIESIRVGQWSIAVGRGFGSEMPSVTVGIISALHRMLGNAIQTDANLSPVNYGGPLLDRAGRVIGICVPMAQRPGELAGVEFYDAGIGFAVTKSRVDEIVAQLKNGVNFYRGWLGIQLDRNAPNEVKIDKLDSKSPLLAAGVRTGDKILSINGKPVKHYGNLVQALYMIPAGEPVNLTLLKSGQEVGLTVMLARSEELAQQLESQEPFDPSNPFPKPDEPESP
jgi:serine protease Do